MSQPFSTSPAARQALDTLGRTEDLRFSPGNSRLAIAGFAQHRICVFDIERGEHLSLLGLVEVASPHLDHPHGLDFLDEDTLVVANRTGNVVIFHLPPADGSPEPRQATVVRVLEAGETEHIRTPGSVAVRRLDGGECDIYVCNNYVHTVSRHRLSVTDQYQVQTNQLLLREHLNVPDGIALSSDGQWIAVSNHELHSIFVYANTPELGPHSEPDGILRQVYYPHGLRFSADGLSLYVADAGSPHVRVYQSGTEGWWGVHHPTQVCRVLSEEAYQAGRINPQEGGPKGLDLTSDGKLLAVTCKTQPLALFLVSELLGTSDFRARGREQVALELYQDRKNWIRVKALRASLSWRITAPLRRLAERLDYHLQKVKAKLSSS